MRSRLICWWKGNKLKGAFSSIEEASKTSGIKENIIRRNLDGAIVDCPDGSKFAWEILAIDYRKGKD